MENRKKYRWPIILTALTLTAALTTAACGGFGAKQTAPPPAASETAVPAAKTDKPAGIVRAGSVAKPLSLPVTSGYSGRIGEVFVSEGQTVKAGQPLFKMETAPPSQANYENARKEYERLNALYQKGAIPRRQVENAAARLQAAQQAGSSDVPVTVAAPVDGIVANLAASSGSEVQAGQQVLTLGSGQNIEVVVPLEQKELNLVQLGAPVAIEAAGRTLAGRVSSIVPEAQENKVPYFLAHIRLADPPDESLTAGMSVNVRIDSGS